MESRSDIVIVSAFGRGIWLASEMAKNGNNTTYIDVSQRLGRSKPEDWNGPFPLLKTNQVSEAQWQFLTSGSTLEPVTEGFTFWLSSGPLELQGPLFEFLRNKIHIHPDVVRYVRDFNTLSESERRIMRYKIEKMSGRENWLAYFSHQIASTVFLSRSTMEENIPLGLFSPCYVRQVTEETLQSQYARLRQAGVKLFLNARIEDLSIQSRVIDGIEIAGERSGIIPGKKFVWMLSAEETKRFGNRVVASLFPDGVIEASWCWVRFSLNIAEGPERDVLPAAFVLAKDAHLPWTHANLCLVERTEKPETFRVWMRVASGRRFQRSYLTEMSQGLVNEFKRRVPAVDVSVDEMPPEFHFGFEELGPPRYPVLLQQDLKKISRAKIKNVHFVCPEDWGGLDWATRMSVENRTYFTITTETREEKRNDLTLHPN